MNEIPCSQRTFPFKINLIELYPPYLRWLRHLIERLGLQNALSVWEGSFDGDVDTFLMQILSAGWHRLEMGGDDAVEDRLNSIVEEFFAAPNLGLTGVEVRTLIERTPPIQQIRQIFGTTCAKRDITAYDALHIRFDRLARLAESLLKTYGKQGELIVYDLMLEGFLAGANATKGSIAEFFEGLTTKLETPNLFTAGLTTEWIHKSSREAVLKVLECEWARYFQDHHPQVGYLMACSTDEASYKAFNPCLRLQRTQTIMEGGEFCDFRIYTVDDVKPRPGV
jgi:hypothetical protein